MTSRHQRNASQTRFGSGELWKYAALFAFMGVVITLMSFAFWLATHLPKFADRLRLGWLASLSEPARILIVFGAVVAFIALLPNGKRRRARLYQRTRTEAYKSGEQVNAVHPSEAPRREHTVETFGLMLGLLVAVLIAVLSMHHWLKRY